MIDSKKIKDNLKTKLIGKRIFHHENLDSTNMEALRLINDAKAQYGDLIIANTQTLGKGQQSHKWTSPVGGIYISIITASKVCEASNLITFASGISCIKAIEKVCSINANLKWVNDILVSNQKLGGILTESSTRGDFSTHITGVGINANAKITNAIDPQFQPVSLSELINNKVDINILIAEICNYFEEYFAIYQTNPDQIINEWVKNSNIFGKKINFTLDNLELTGTIQSLNHLGHLVVITDENQEYVLSSSRDMKIIF